MLIALLALAMAIYTDNRWEDFYITLKSSRNLAAGNGLVFHVGEKVHTFTSPLGVLIPSLFFRLVGLESDTGVLWLFRIFSIALLACGGRILIRLLRELGCSWWVSLTGALLPLIDCKSLAFSINGMETGIYLFFICLVIWAQFSSGQSARSIILGTGWAGLLWTRPDGFVIAAILALAQMILGPLAARDGDAARRLGWRFLKAAVICAALYLPWFVWSWHYYGSPVPNTILAKSLNSGSSILQWLKDGLLFPFTAGQSTAANQAFMPIYGWMGGWHPAFAFFGRVLSVVAIYCWAIPRAGHMTRVFSFAAFCACFYFSRIIPFLYPWYLPPFTLLCSLALAGLLMDLQNIAPARSNVSRSSSRLRLLAQIFAAAAFVDVLTLTLLSAVELKCQQTVCEGQRREIGDWLHEHASPGDSVFLECLGYIGYFSNLKTYDFPGLSSPEVVALRRERGPNARGAEYSMIILRMKPDWLVLRPSEFSSLPETDAARIASAYHLERTFDQTATLSLSPSIPGQAFLMHDSVFLLFKKQAK